MGLSHPEAQSHHPCCLHSAHTRIRAGPDPFWRESPNLLLSECMSRRSSVSSAQAVQGQLQLSTQTMSMLTQCVAGTLPGGDQQCRRYHELMGFFSQANSFQHSPSKELFPTVCPLQIPSLWWESIQVFYYQYSVRCLNHFSSCVTQTDGVNSPKKQVGWFAWGTLAPTFKAVNSTGARHIL